MRKARRFGSPELPPDFSMIRAFTLIILLSLIIFLGAPNAAIAIKRIGGGGALPLDVLCNSSQIFIAHVVSAESKDCRRQYPAPNRCSPTDVVSLSLMIDEMLATDGKDQSRSVGRNLQAGDFLNVVSILDNRLRHGTEVGAPLNDEYGVLKVSPATGQPLSDDGLSVLLVGKKFLFGISLTDWSRPANDLYANIWPLALDSWVRGNLRERADRKCLRLN